MYTISVIAICCDSFHIFYCPGHPYYTYEELTEPANPYNKLRDSLIKPFTVYIFGDRYVGKTALKLGYQDLSNKF